MSESMRPTRCPSLPSASARFAATVDFPTPPLPEATATLKRTSRNRAASAGATPAAPRGGAADGGCTAIRTVTAFTPGSERSFSFASRSISSAARGDSVVISRRKETFPPPTARSLTKPKETMSRDRPGNFTVRSVSSTLSSVSSGVGGIEPPAAKLSRTSRGNRCGGFLAQRGAPLPSLLRQRGAVLRREQGDGDRLSDGEDHRSRSRQERSARQDAPCPRDPDGEQSEPRAQSEEGRALLEREQVPRAGPRLLGKDHDRTAALQAGERRLYGRGAAGRVAPVDRDESGRADRPTEHGHAEDGALGEEPDLHRRVREEHEDVGQALVVRDQHDALVGSEPLAPQDADGDARKRQDRPGPPSREAQEPVPPGREIGREDRRKIEEKRRRGDRNPDEKGASDPHRHGIVT